MTFEPQPGEGVTHAGRVRKADGDRGWDQPAQLIARALRAYDPWPGVRLPLGEERVQVLAGQPLPRWTASPGAAAPGDILEVGDEGVTVMAGDAPFLVRRLKPAGRREMAAADWARGRRGLSGGP